MKRVAALATLLLSLVGSQSSLAASYLTCDTMLSKVGSPGPDSQTIHAAGSGRAFYSDNTIDYFEQMWADADLFTQGTSTQWDSDSGFSAGEVITYVRADVLLGHVYEATLLISAQDGSPAEKFCSDTLAVEDPNPPSGGGDGGGSGGGRPSLLREEETLRS